jgi:hypothetical protein
MTATNARRTECSPGDVLRRTAGADSWQDGGFERALSAAVEASRIRRLPADFYAGGEPPARVVADGSD